MPLHIKAEDVPFRINRPIQGEGEKEVARVYGMECNLSPCYYRPGYHTRPHYHDCEQINYIVDGEIYFFVENQAFHCKKGDFVRIPRNRIHWAWNRFNETALVIEVHAPPLIGGKVAERAVGLFADDESGKVPFIAENLYDRPFDPSVAEADLPA